MGDINYEIKMADTTQNGVFDGFLSFTVTARNDHRKFHMFSVSFCQPN